MRRFLRWGSRLALALLIVGLAGVAAVIFLRDKIAHGFLVKRIHAATGMEVRIDAVHLGIRTPSFSISGLKIYNTADFGGAMCLDMPELRIEYDRSALRSHEIHLTLLRLNLAELSMVSRKDGRKNFASPQELRTEIVKSKNPDAKWKFTGIDLMVTTLGKLRATNLASGQGEEIDSGITNQILRNVKSWNDLAPLGLTMLLQGKTSSSNIDLGQFVDRVLGSP